jgi:dienelactone hydrolase
MKKTKEKLPEPVKVDSRICFSIKYFAAEADADAYAAWVRKQGITYNGGFFHGMSCGRDTTWDHVDPKLGQLYAVTD